MIDIKLLRSNPDFVKAAVKKREMNLDDVIDEIPVSYTHLKKCIPEQI